MTWKNAIWKKNDVKWNETELSKQSNHKYWMMLHLYVFAVLQCIQLGFLESKVLSRIYLRYTYLRAQQQTVNTIKRWRYDKFLYSVLIRLKIRTKENSGTFTIAVVSSNDYAVRVSIWYSKINSVDACKTMLTHLVIQMMNT